MKLFCSKVVTFSSLFRHTVANYILLQTDDVENEKNRAVSERAVEIG
jgi:hypothetical protein